jgi:hypothetical protein
VKAIKLKRAGVRRKEDARTDERYTELNALDRSAWQHTQLPDGPRW